MRTATVQMEQKIHMMVTRRGRLGSRSSSPQDEAPLWGIARWTWSNAGLRFRSRGRGSIARSRDPGGRVDWWTGGLGAGKGAMRMLRDDAASMLRA